MDVSQLFQAIAAFAIAHPRLTFAFVATYLFAQVWQARSKEWRATVVRKYPRATLLFDLFNALFTNVATVVRLLYWRGLRGIAARPETGSLTVEQTEGTPSPEHIELSPGAEPARYTDGGDGSTSGFAQLRMLVSIALLTLAAVYFAACPTMPKVDHCTPLAVRCNINGVPQHCDTDGRWTPVDDQCAPYGNECVVTRAYSSRPIAVCLSPTNAREAREHDEGIDADAGN